MTEKMNKPNALPETLQKVARGLELEAAGHSREAIAEHLGYKNIACWTTMRRTHYEQAKALVRKPLSKPNISDSPHAQPKSDNTAKPDPVLDEIKHAAHTAPPADETVKPTAQPRPSASLKLSMRISMEGRHLSYVSDGKTLGIRAKDSKEKYLHIPLDEAGAFITELHLALRAARQGAEVAP